MTRRQIGLAAGTVTVLIGVPLAIWNAKEGRLLGAVICALVTGAMFVLLVSQVRRRSSEGFTQ